MKELIRNILKEESTKQILLDEIKYFGIESAERLVGDIDSLFGVLNIETPIDFLNLFNDLDVVKSNDRPEIMLFRYKKGKNLMAFDSKNNNVSVNFFEIWSILYDQFQLTEDEIKKVIEEWLYEVYGLSGLRLIRYQLPYLIKLT
jgi:hypothetical protein